MSFFGFDATLPPEGSSRNNARASGFSQVADPFAGLDDDEGEALDFEDTYDGLGDQLDEGNDAFNADTFGDSTALGGDSGPVGRDFDFSGQTAQMANTMDDEQMLYAARQKPPKPSPQNTLMKPVGPSYRSGYEAYSDPNHVRNLEASTSIWGSLAKKPQAQTHIQQLAPPQQPTPPLQQTASKKMMSLEEVEAAMRAQSVVPKPTEPPVQHTVPVAPPQAPPTIPTRQTQTYAHPPQILQRPQQQRYEMEQPSHPPQYPQPQPQRPVPPPGMQQPPQILQRPGHLPAGSRPELPAMPQELQKLQQGQGRNVPLPNQARQPPQQVEAPQPTQVTAMHSRGPSYNGPVAPRPQQMMNMSEQERAAFLEEEAKRAKRNHKIHLLSKDNGLMTPQDKNFITRIQLQQLMTATGNVDEQDPEAALAEDFYYEVYSQIRGAPRQDPNQPLNHFAQTYLNQTGGRGNRRYPRGGDSHMRRMEQQVQRAVEAAKLKPKNKQLVLEGSLGKISFSNAKTPKPLLNIKRNENNEARPQSSGKMKGLDTFAGRKAVLRDIEKLYTTLMQMEDLERRMPPPPREGGSADAIQEYQEWRQRIHDDNETLWQQLKVMEPIDPSSSTPHPFIAILSHPKGKKLIPRVFRQIDDQQRLTILTMIVVHLDQLDVVRLAIPTREDTQLPMEVRDQIDLFSQAVMPNLFSYVNDAQLGIVIGLVGLIIDRVNVPSVIRTKIGLGLLTMFISRAEIIKQAGQAGDHDLKEWNAVYNRLFDTLEPQLSNVFPGAIKTGDDMYVWQFLAAMGVGASPEQQQRLVIAVKERVMDTVAHAKTLPEDLGRPRLDNVNLFMKAIGLDVEMLG